MFASVLWVSFMYIHGWSYFAKANSKLIGDKLSSACFGSTRNPLGSRLFEAIRLSFYRLRFVPNDKQMEALIAPVFVHQRHFVPRRPDSRGV